MWAFMVREMLKRFFPLTGAGHVLAPEEHLPTSATTLLVMSSNCCFQKPSFVRQLFQAEARGIGAIPIIVCDSFQFPSDALFQELRPLSTYILSDTLRHAGDLIALIKSLFEEICIHMRPQDSQGVLEVCDAMWGFRFMSQIQAGCQHVTRWLGEPVVRERSACGV